MNFYFREYISVGAECVSAAMRSSDHFRKNIHGVAARVVAKEHNMRAVFLFVPIHALAVGFKKVLLCGQVIDIALRPTVVVAGIPIEPCVTFFARRALISCLNVLGTEPCCAPAGKRTRMFVCGEPTAFSYAAAHLLDFLHERIGRGVTGRKTCV